MRMAAVAAALTVTEPFANLSFSVALRKPDTLHDLVAARSLTLYSKRGHAAGALTSLALSLGGAECPSADFGLPALASPPAQAVPDILVFRGRNRERTTHGLCRGRIAFHRSLYLVAYLLGKRDCRGPDQVRTNR